MFGFLYKDLIDNLANELGNSERYFGRVEFELDILVGVLNSLIAHWNR